MTKSKEHQGTLEITTTMGCANNCAYCPQSLLLSTYYSSNKQRKSSISLNEFKLLCKKVPKNFVLNFGGMSEPFQNPNCVDMIKYADSIGRKIRVNTTLRYISVEQLKSIQNINYTTFCVHAPDKDLVQKQEITEEYLQKLKIVKNFANIEFMSIGRLDEKVCQAVDNKITTSKIVLRGGNLDITKLPSGIEIEKVDFKEHNGAIICTRAFDFDVKRPTQNLWPLMLPDGTILLCCADYGMQHVLGNIYEKDLEVILNDKPMKQIEMKLKSGNTASLICKNCEWAVPYDEKKWKNFKKHGAYSISVKPKATLLETLCSIKNEYKNNKKYKVVRVFGLKFKFKQLSKIDKLYKKIYSNNYTYNDEKELLKELYKNRTNENLNIDNPKTFREKLQWLKLNYRNPKLTLCADKYKVREFVKSTIGEKYLTNLIGVYDTVENIDFAKLPRNFVIKVNWGSGQNIIVRDKSLLNLDEIKTKLKTWMQPHSNNYYGGLEWCYKNIEPKIIIEEYLEVLDQTALDYKFLCFNGKPYYCWVSNKNLAVQERSFYNMQWEMQDIELVEPNKVKAQTPLPKPDNFDEMVQIVNKLAKDFVHVRVDLYKLGDGSIKFGELTFMTSSGYSPWAPNYVDKQLGDLIDLSLVKKECR